jgi:hypothetical protein
LYKFNEGPVESFAFGGPSFGISFEKSVLGNNSFGFSVVTAIKFPAYQN